jgi:hypothetical protein
MARDKYTPTEARFKGGAKEMYVTYDLGRSFGEAPRVKRVDVPGSLINARVGEFKNRMGRRVHGVRIQYRQDREPYTRSSGARVGRTTLTLSKIVEVPTNARNITFRESLPERYEHVLQNVS